MKGKRYSFVRWPQAYRRRVRSEAVLAFPNRGQGKSGEFADKQPSNQVDIDMLLHFSQQLYAHALTLQEVIKNHGEAPYEALRPKYDRQAAQQFEIFYQNFKRD